MIRNSYFLFIIFIKTTFMKFTHVASEAALNKATISDLTYFSCTVQIINNENEHICGGCLLDEANVLTSARCVKDFFQDNGKTNLKVRGGDVVITKSNLPTYQIRDVWKLVVHSDYNEGSFENDLALLKIEYPFMPSAYLHSVDAGVTGPKGRCFLPGWTNDGENTTVLHYITVYITKGDKCTRKVPNAICAESKDNEGACVPDLGGPLVCGNKVYGVFIGPREACEGKPALFTNLSPFEDWMDLHIHRDNPIDKRSGRRFRSGGQANVHVSFTCLILAVVVILIRLV